MIHVLFTFPDRFSLPILHIGRSYTDKDSKKGGVITDATFHFLHCPCNNKPVFCTILLMQPEPVMTTMVLRSLVRLTLCGLTIIPHRDGTKQ